MFCDYTIVVSFKWSSARKRFLAVFSNTNTTSNHFPNFLYYSVLVKITDTVKRCNVTCVGSLINAPQIIRNKCCERGPNLLSSLFEKTRKSNRLICRCHYKDSTSSRLFKDPPPPPPLQHPGQKDCCYERIIGS